MFKRLILLAGALILGACGDSYKSTTETAVTPPTDAAQSALPPELAAPALPRPATDARIPANLHPPRA